MLDANHLNRSRLTAPSNDLHISINEGIFGMDVVGLTLVLVC